MENRLKIRSSWFLMLLAVMLALSSCRTFDSNIWKFNETDPQQPAAITISDPQVFARETLINDRLREQKFLNDLLNESEQIKFRDSISTPALIRDVETLEAFRAAIELSFDPAKGAEALLKKRLDDLKGDIDLTNKETELAKAKKELEKAKAEGEVTGQDASNTTNAQQAPQSKSDQAGGTTSGSPAATQSSQTKTDVPQNQTTAPTDAKLSDLKTRVSDLATRLDKIGTDFGKRKVTVPIPDAERTRDAYRAELRQRLNAINLDDLHDYDGNALYRLQFRATVMPGQYKDKFGIARLTFHPPLLKKEEINQLYRTWLNHLALRLNQPLPEVRKTCPKPVAALLRLEQAGLFEILQIRIEPCTIYVPIPSGLWTQVPAPNSSFDQLTKQLDAETEKARIVKNVIPILEIIRDANQENKVSDEIQKGIDKIRKVSSAGATLVEAPQLFLEILADPNAELRARGEAYLYATSPLEKSQRMSTHAQVARSAELALSIAANLVTQGISGKGDSDWIRESTGIVEGFENQPIVVGFADRLALSEQEVIGADPSSLSQKSDPQPPPRAAYQAPQAGWVFGPAVHLDPKNKTLQLVQRFASHEVSADLSVPGWWPYVQTTLETVWVGNLHKTGRPIRMEANQGFRKEEFRIYLPLNTADLDGLSAIIARKTVGTYLPTMAIQNVDPFFISACSKQVDLLIKGVNVWRGTRVFLGGIEADNIAILPDMEGIAARFDLDKLFAIKNEALTGLGLDQGVPLVVWTRNGSDIHTLRLIGNRTPAGCIGRTTVSPATSLNRFEIVDISPAQICANANVANFFVKGFLPGTGEVTAIFGNSLLKNLTRLGGVPGEQSAIFKLTFVADSFGPVNYSIPLSMTNGMDISSAPVRLIACEKPETQASSVIGTYTVAELKDNKYLFTVNLKDINPSLVDADLRIGVLPSTSIRGPWILSTTAPVALPIVKSTYEVKFEIAKTAAGPTEKAFGKELELQFALLQPRVSGDKVLEPMKGSLVYYPSSDKANVGVTPTSLSTLTKSGNDVTFTLPNFYNKAYSDLTKAKLKSEIEKKPNIGLAVEADFSKIDKDRKVKGTIKLKDDDAEKAWKELKAGDYKVNFSFEGTNVPDIQTIQIKKQEKKAE